RSTGSGQPASPPFTERRSTPSSAGRKHLPPEPFFAGNGLDRADHLRADPAAILTLHGHKEALELSWEGGAPAIDETGKLRWQPVDGTPPVLLGFNLGSPRFSSLP